MAKNFKDLAKRTSNANTKKIAKKRIKVLKKEFKPDPEALKQSMIERYGWSVNYVDVDMYLTYNEMVAYFGEQCEEYEPLCANCSNWVRWHKTGMAQVSFERDELLKILLGE